MLTDFGLFFTVIALSIILFSLWIGTKWSNLILNKDKPESQQEKAGCIGSLFTSTVFFSIFSIAVSMSIYLPSAIYKTFMTPSFQATVTHHTSRWEDSTYTDSSGKTRNTKTLMYSPYVSFRDSHGNELKDIPLSIRSSSPLETGSVVSIGYTENERIAYEKSHRSALLFAAASLMLLMLWFLALWIILYSFKCKTDRFLDIAVFFILRILIPIGATAMFCMLSYVVFEYFFLGDPKHLPIWVVVTCIIFSLSLIPLLILLIIPKQQNEGPNSQPNEHESHHN